MKKSSTSSQVPRPTKPVAPSRPSPPLTNDVRTSRPAEKQPHVPPTAPPVCSKSPRIVVDPSLVSTTGDLGTFIEYRGGLWKVAYSGPVYFTENDDTYLGLIACSSAPNSSGDDEPRSPVGNCNGTVADVAYFVCDDNRGLLLPAQEVLSCSSVSPGRGETMDKQPQQQQSQALSLAAAVVSPLNSDKSPRGHQEDLESSLSGLVAGAQSIRRLRDEASPAASFLSVNSHSTPNHQKQTSSSNHCDAACETDAFLLDALHLQGAQSSCGEWLHTNTSIEKVRACVSQLYQPLSSASRRVLDVVEPFLEQELTWLDEKKRFAALLDERLDWNRLQQQQSSTTLSQRLTELAAAPEGSTPQQALTMVDTWATVDAVPHRLQTVIDQVCDDIRQAMKQAPDTNTDDEGNEGVPRPLAVATAAAHRAAVADAQTLIDAALQPIAEYTHIVELRVECAAVAADDPPTNAASFTKTMKEIEYACEQIRRLQFSIDSVNQDAERAMGEGRVDELESLGHARVDLAQKMQCITCDLITRFPDLQASFAEAPRAKLRDAVAAVKKSLPIAQQDLQKQYEECLAAVKEQHQRLEVKKEEFLRDAFQNSNALSDHVHIVTEAHQKEHELHEQLRNLLSQLVDARVHKYQAVSALDACVASRALLFQQYHESVAECEIQVTHDIEKKRVFSAASQLADNLLLPVNQLSESEEASLMAVQRRLFELQAEAHELHKRAYREVCLSTEELAHRKDQAHRVICDRLDRCRAELEVAMDSTDDSAVTRGMARERNELERAAIELHGDIFAIRSIGVSCGGVFEERSLPFLIKCGKEYIDPMIEAKQLTNQRAQKLLGIKEELRTSTGL
jgi:hypothetical protein